MDLSAFREADHKVKSCYKGDRSRKPKGNLLITIRSAQGSYRRTCRKRRKSHARLVSAVEASAHLRVIANGFGDRKIKRVRAYFERGWGGLVGAGTKSVIFSIFLSGWVGAGGGDNGGFGAGGVGG
jgi:hypothetical protein